MSTSQVWLIMAICIIFIYSNRVSGGDPEECFSEYTGVKYKIGESFSMHDQCGKFICKGNDVWGGEFCPPIEFNTNLKNCEYIEKDISKPFPQCCESIDCDH